jgi:hypothetical protein
MKKCLILILMALLMISIVMAIDECKGVMNSRDIPCLIISTWQFPNQCGTYTIQTYRNATLLDTRTMANYSLTGRCNVTFNYTKQDSYLLNWSSGDSSKIIIEEDDDMILGIVLGVGIISALLLFFAFKLDDEHTILKILFMISSITLLILIPVSTFITTTSNAGKIFYRTFLYIFIAFWLYVFLYFCYWILRKLGWIASGEENES